MSRFKLLLLAVAPLALSPIAATQAAQIDAGERAALQAAMVRHIDQQTIDGAYLDVDMKTGELKKYAPSKSHPMVVAMGDGYVLCTDFVNADGVPTNVDFYTARKGSGFSVFRAAIGHRDALMKLIGDGKAAPVD